jgi:hypothetical protein
MYLQGGRVPLQEFFHFFAEPLGVFAGGLAAFAGVLPVFADVYPVFAGEFQDPGVSFLRLVKRLYSYQSDQHNGGNSPRGRIAPFYGQTLCMVYCLLRG